MNLQELINQLQNIAKMSAVPDSDAVDVVVDVPLNHDGGMSDIEEVEYDELENYVIIRL